LFFVINAVPECENQIGREYWSFSTEKANRERIKKETCCESKHKRSEKQQARNEERETSDQSSIKVAFLACENVLRCYLQSSDTKPASSFSFFDGLLTVRPWPPKEQNI